MKKLILKRCRYCLTKENLTLDHKHPISLGGNSGLKNLQCLCLRCNQAKSNIPDGQIKALWKWMHQVDIERVALGKRPRFTKVIKTK